MSVKQNIIAGWVTHGVVLLIGFFLMPYVLRTLGESQYGAWVFLNAVAGYSGLVYAGFGTTICRYVADLGARRNWEKLNQVVSTVQAVYCGSAMLVLTLAVLFAVWAPHWNTWGETPLQDVQIAVLLLGVSIGIGMIGSAYGGVLIGMQRLDIERGIQLLLGVTRLVLVVAFLTYERGLVTLAWVFLAVTVLEQLLYAACAYRLVPSLSVGFWNVNRSVLRECFGFSVFNAVAQVAEQLIYFTDTVVIGLLLGQAAVVPYYVSLRIAQMIRVPVAQIGEAVLPRAGVLQALASAGDLRRLVTRGMGLAFLLSAGFFIGTTYFGSLLIETWIGKLYAESPLVLCVLVAAQTVALPMSVLRKALVGLGEARVPAWIDLAEAVCNLLLSLLLIRYWGILGVAFGTLIPVILAELLLLLPFAAQRFGLPVRQLLVESAGPMLIPLLALLAYCETISRLAPTPNWLILGSITLGGGAVLAGAAWISKVVRNNWERMQSAAAQEPLAN